MWGAGGAELWSVGRLEGEPGHEARAGDQALFRGRWPTRVPPAGHQAVVIAELLSPGGHQGRHQVVHSRWVWAVGESRRTLGHAVRAFLGPHPLEVVW